MLRLYTGSQETGPAMLLRSFAPRGNEHRRHICRRLLPIRAEEGAFFVATGPAQADVRMIVVRRDARGGRGAEPLAAPLEAMSDPMRAHRSSSIATLALLVALALGTLGALGALAGCGGTSSAASTNGGPEKPALAVDALGNPIVIPAQAPQRIISETPADSEILAALGVDARVVAVDYYTDYPADLAAKPKITNGQTFTLNDEAILGYQPDLVVGYGAYFKADEQQLIAAGVPVVDLPLVATVQQSLTELRLVGQLVHADSAAARQLASLQGRIDGVTHKVAGVQTPSVYVEDGTYNGQFSTFGQGSYGADLIRLAGGSNIFAGDGDSGGYPNVSAESIIQANPAVIVLVEGVENGGNPSTVAQRPGWSAIAAVQSGRVYALNSDDFSRPDAPRLVSALEELARALHPDLFV